MQTLLTVIQDPGSFQALPAAAHILAGIGVLTGLVFWLMGRKLLKGAFALFGGVAGAMAGFFLLPTVMESFYGVPSPYLGLAAGALIGLSIGVFLFRFAVAITTGLALGLAGALIGAVYIHFAPAPPSETPAIAAPALNTPIPPTGLSPTTSDRIQKALDAARPMAQDVADFVSHRADEVYTAWKALPTHEQMVMAISGFGAASIGFALGLLAPKRSSAIATALFGSALWMGCGVWLAEAANMPGYDRLHNAVVWLPAWLILAMAGFVLQIKGLGRKKAAA